MIKKFLQRLSLMIARFFAPKHLKRHLKPFSPPPPPTAEEWEQARKEREDLYKQINKDIELRRRCTATRKKEQNLSFGGHNTKVFINDKEFKNIMGVEMDCGFGSIKFIIFEQKELMEIRDLLALDGILKLVGENDSGKKFNIQFDVSFLENIRFKMDINTVMFKPCLDFSIRFKGDDRLWVDQIAANPKVNC